MCLLELGMLLRSFTHIHASNFAYQIKTIFLVVVEVAGGGGGGIGIKCCCCFTFFLNTDIVICLFVYLFHFFLCLIPFSPRLWPYIT